MAILLELQKALELAQIESARLAAEAIALAQEYAQAGNPTSGPIYDKVVANSYARKENAARIDELIAQIAQLDSGGTSAGNIIQNDDQGTVPNASTQRPNSPQLVVDNNGRISPPPDTTSGSNALVSPTPDALDYGTDAPIRPGVITQGAAGQTQTTVNTNPVTGDGREGPAVPGGTPGASAAGEDQGTGINSTRAEIDNLFTGDPIIAQDNVLDQYASYTYSASVYLMTVEAASRMVQNKDKNLAGSQLLFQSAGAPVRGRNTYFSNDYYIEKLSIDQTIAGKGTNWSHNAQEIKMTVVEPTGITFLNNLAQAVNEYLGSVNDPSSDPNAKKGYLQSIYLLVIRFYGYDDAGNIVRGGVPKADGSSDPNAYVEKWYPFKLNRLKYKVGSKLVEYEIEATAAQFQLNAGDQRGSIPYNMEFSGRTVKELLTGPAAFSSTASNPYGQTLSQLTQEGIDLIVAAGGTVPAPLNIASAPTPKGTVRQGLFTAMNQFQQNLKDSGVIDVPDVYEVEFIGESIPNATTDSGKVANAASMAVPGTPADQKLDSKQSVDFSSVSLPVVAGQQLVTVIDQIIRNSTYISSQQIYIVNKETNKLEPNGKGAKNLAWFITSFEATPIKYDAKRQDYAYRMRYIIKPYQINEAPPPWFPVPKFNGVHKVYNYWFTGQNNSVLEYEQNFDALYYEVLSNGFTQALSRDTSNGNELRRRGWGTRSEESSQQSPTRANEPAANLASYLYNQSDLAEAHLTIVGDPGWLTQGEAFAGISRNNPNLFSAFLPDGTINSESREVLFEVAFNTPTDYNLSTGIMDVGKNNYAADRSRGQGGYAVNSYIYKAYRVMSNFEKGKFTQKIDGVLRKYPINPADRNATSAAQNFNLSPDLAATQQALSAITSSTQRFGTLSPTALGPTLSTPLFTQVLNKAASSGANVITNSAVAAVTKVINQTNVPPTSSGQPVGTVNNTQIDPTTNQPISANERVVGVDATVEGDSQVSAPSDDAGYDPGNYSSSEESLNRDFGNDPGP